MFSVPDSIDRVPAHTSEAVNERIRETTRQNVRRFGGHPEDIALRLHDLNAEWDIERAIEANAAALALAGSVLAATVDRRFIALPIVVSAFLLQHAVQGWCPPVPLFRRLGFRTPAEIEEERNALRLIRGDFDSAAKHKLRPEEAWELARH